MRGAWGSSALAPPDIGNRVFWWDAAGLAGGSFTDLAATLPAADNSRVAAIKGAEGHAFTQAITTDRPLFRLNRQNGLPGLFFERGRVDHLEDPTGGLLAAVQALTTATILVVWRPTLADGAMVSFRDNSNDGLFIGTGASANQITAYRRGNLSVSDQATITEADNFGRASAALVTYPGFSGSLRLDDNHSNSDTQTTDSADGGAWDNGRLGAKTNTSDAFEGDLYEILIWDQAADSGQRAAALAYVTSKWALT